MQRTILALAIGIVAFLELGCPSNELIGPATQPWQLLVATSNGTATSLATYSMPEGTLLDADVYASANGSPLQGSVTAMAQFRSMLFLLQPQQQRIEVLDAASFRHLGTIATSPHGAVALCFANGTTAYTANADSTVSVIDLTVLQVVKVLSVQQGALALAAMGNQVGVCNQRSGTLSIIDTRTNAVTETIAVPPYPTYIVGSPQLSTSFCVVSLGNGKIDIDHQPTAAMVSFYDPFARQSGAQQELAQLQKDATQTRPYGLVTGGYPTAFVLLDDEVQMIDLAGQRVVGPVLSGSYRGATYNFARDNIVVWGPSQDGTEFVVLAQQSGNVLERVVLPIATPTAVLAR